MRFYFVRVLIKYSLPIESWLKFPNELWRKGLKNFLDKYVEHQPDNSGASFRMMRTHRAFNLRLKGLLVRDEWYITWDCAVKALAGGYSNSSSLVRRALVCTIAFIFSFCPPLTLRIREDSLSLLLSCKAFGPRSHNVLSRRS